MNRPRLRRLQAWFGAVVFAREHPVDVDAINAYIASAEGSEHAAT